MGCEPMDRNTQQHTSTDISIDSNMMAARRSTRSAGNALPEFSKDSPVPDPDPRKGRSRSRPAGSRSRRSAPAARSASVAASRAGGSRPRRSTAGRGVKTVYDKVRSDRSETIWWRRAH